MHFLLFGFYSNPDLLSLAARLILGIFFVLARFRWFYDPHAGSSCWLNPSRHNHLAWKLCKCGYGLHPVLADIVAVIEMSAGLGVLFGLFTWLSALGLAVVLTFATLCTAREKVMEQKPVDSVDCVSCYFWRVEGPYLALAVALVFVGGGKYSLDYIVGRLF